MSNSGRPPPVGPGHTVIAHPAFTDEPPPQEGNAAGMPIPPTTVRDPEVSAPPVYPARQQSYASDPYGAPSPYAHSAPPPYSAQYPYGAPPPPYGAPRQYSSPDLGFAQPQPFGVPPPPPGRSRSRGAQGGPSLLTIGAISTLLIGGVVTTIALVRNKSVNDDKPIPTVEVPAASVPSDPPGAANVPSDAPTASDAPAMTSAPTLRPGLGKGTRPGLGQPPFGQPNLGKPGTFPNRPGPTGPANPRNPQQPHQPQQPRPQQPRQQQGIPQPFQGF